ncbi:MAG: hypothetical protein AB4050_07260 [Synechococcus sp.]
MAFAPVSNNRLTKSDMKQALARDTTGELETLLARLVVLMGEAESRAWLVTPNVHLDDETPWSFIAKGDLNVLGFFVEAIESGQPG